LGNIFPTFILYPELIIKKLMEKRAKVKPGDIVVGRPLHRDVYTDEGTLLLKKDYLIETQKQLDALLARGLYFISDVSTRVPVTKPTIKDTQISSPFELIDDIYGRLSALCSSQNIKTNFSSRIMEIGACIQRSCQIDADASLGAIFLSKEWSYAITHQIHCAIICEIILKHLGRSPLERLSVLAAALTMNISMVELQDLLFNRKEKLDEILKQEVQRHSQRGTDLLNDLGVKDKVWLTAVFQHHEFMDGSGYPQGLSGDDIDQNARILTLADVYCAKLSPRAYRDPLPPNVAAREIFSGSRGQCFDQDLAKIFIKILGIFHPGSFVKLTNGEIALVTGRGEKIHHPLVHSVVKPDGTPWIAPKRRDCSQENFAITDCIAQEKVKVSINKFLLWGYWESEQG
jgi:HD-GYP domain-containing protein (c-di-GMP phosphodiesterase class II)